MSQYPRDYYKRYKNFNHARLKRLILEEIKPFIDLRPKGKANLIIDIGCGIGRLTSVFKDYAKSVVGLDISLDAIKLIDKNDKGIFFIKGDALRIPVKARVCDVCTCIHVIEHVKDFNLLLNEIHRIAADKSKVIFITPNKKWIRFSLPFLKDKTHVKEFTIDELERAVSAYFSVEKIKPVSMFTSFGFLNPVMNAFFKPDIYISAIKI